MKQNEKRYIAVAVAIFVLLLVVRGIPFLLTSYEEGRDEIAFLEQRIERLQDLVEQAPEIKDEEAAKRRQMMALQNWVFPGQDQNLIGSSVQRQLRQAVEDAGVLARSYDPPRYSEVDGWLMVSQEMDFTIEQEKILTFLSLLELSRPRLHVTEFSINRNRRQFLGSITVTGFSKRD
jgi:hypothetical protein